MEPLTAVGPATGLQPAFETYWRAARQAGYPAALWRLPGQTDKHLIVHFNERLPTLPPDLEELPGGFAISPFLNPDLEQTLFMRADLHVVGNEHTGTVGQPAEQPLPAPFRQALRRARQRSEPNVVGSHVVAADPHAQPQYESAAAEAVAQMQQGAFRKVVLSRTKSVSFETEPDVVVWFDRLCAVYPTAFVSVVWLPERNQTWVCATPERLVSQDAAGLFRTVSLAGTQSAVDAHGQPKRPADAMWSQKEIEEQALVSRYIIECFKRIRLREYLEEGPKTAVAGNLMHLRTDFTVDTQATNFPQIGTVMLRLLHPTSAVCGMPREAALAFIRQHETHDRELYSGFLGPVNLPVCAATTDTESHLFVHIRCLKLEGNMATLYAGAGLTEDSVPAREWHETELKCQTLLNVVATT